MSLQFFLNGTEIQSPIERLDVGIQVDFATETQGNIETDSFIFVNEAYTIIKNYIESGQNGGIGIFEGIDFQIQFSENSQNLFDGFLDMKSLEFLEADAKIGAKIIKTNGLNNLSERLQGLTFDLLESNGTIKKSDCTQVEMIVEKEVNGIELALLSLSIFIMLREIYDTIRKISQNIAIISAILAAGITGSVGSLIYAIASVLFDSIYIGFLSVSLFNMVNELISYILPIPKTVNGITLRTGLTKIFKHLGYNFQSTIQELDQYTYLPSKNNTRTEKGIPFASDYGYIADEFVNLCLDMFQAKIYVQGSNVWLRTENDAFFENQSTYILPDILLESYKFNTNELKESVLIAFDDDISDSYTVKNWKGTNCVITTTPISSTDPKKNMINGLLEKRFPIALGNRKNSMTDLEKGLQSFIKVATSLFSTLGKSQNLKTISDRIGQLKVSQDFFDKPKLLKVLNRKLTNDYRNNLSAKYLWDKYISYNSFISNNYKRQRKIYENVVIPFSFLDYQKITENSYFTTFDGKRGKFTNLNWVIESDKAEVSFYIEEIYTRNLKEEIYEPE
jgi:hypothetical protein